MDHRLLVLGLLKLQQMHGYQLNDLIDRRLKYLTDLKKPTLYHLLVKLEREGLVTKSVSRQGRRPERFTYQLSPVGEERFALLLRQNLQETHAAYFEDDVGLLFLNELPAAEAQVYLERKRVGVEERINWIQQAAVQHQADTPAYYILHHHEMHLRAERAWLDQVMERLVHRVIRQDLLAGPPKTTPPKKPRRRQPTSKRGKSNEAIE